MTFAAAEPEEIEFATSGSTAASATWVRSMDQLRAEASLVAATVLGPIDHVVTFAPRIHLYGSLFGEVLPGLLGVEVDDLSADPLAPPAVVPGRRTLYVCLPSSWPVLHRSARGAGDLSGSIALHGTGPVTVAVTEAARALAAVGLRAVELFGSTETGGVAYRPMLAGPAEPWQLFPDVTFVDDADADGTCLLHVRSPRIARRVGEPASETHRLGDLVRPAGADRFVFIGRSNRLVKINGRRCDLGRIEELVAEAAPGVDAVCVGVPDRIRGEHYELFATGEVDDVLLGAALGDLPRPRAVHRVDRVPRTITGKVKIDRLFAMAVGMGRS